MPRVTELCADLAQRFRFEESKVLGYSRVLREAGMVTTGARGVNAPDGVPMDVARLLFAMMLRTKKEDAASGAELFGNFLLSAPDEAPKGAALRCEDALAKTLEWYGHEGAVEVSDKRFEFQVVRDAAYASLLVHTWSDDHEDWQTIELRYLHSSILEIDPANDPVPDEWLGAIHQYRSGFHEVPRLTHEDLLAIGQVLAGHMKPGETVK